MEKYFKNLNYSLSNEDSSVELSILERMAVSKANVLAVSGAGSRVLPLLTHHTQEIHILDLADEQLSLVKLRIKAAQNLSREDFLAFMGYTTRPIDRKSTLIRLGFPEWIELPEALEKGFIFLGRWEKFLVKLGRSFRHMFFLDFKPLFQLNTFEERQRWYTEHFPKKRLQFFLQVFANPTVFNLFLYKGGFAKSPENFADFLQRVFYQILVVKNPRESFFAQMLFLGHLAFEEGWPIETRAGVLDAVKSFKGQIHYHQDDLIAHLKKNSDYDFLSLSDVPSYLSDQQLSELEDLLMKAKQRPFCAVMRSFRRHPQFTERFVKNMNPDLQKWALDHDTIGVYKFHIFSNT